MRFVPRSSGQITSAFSAEIVRGPFLRPVCETNSFRLGKRLAPGKAAGVTPGKVKADLLVFIPVLVNHEAPFGLHEAVKTTYTDNHGRSPLANVTGEE